VYGIVVSVTACIRGETRADVAWSLEPSLTPQFDPADALAITPGGGRLGGMLGGAFTNQLVDLAGVRHERGRVVALPVGPLEGPEIGLDEGTSLPCMLTPAEQLPDKLWPLLLEREPVCIVAELDGTFVAKTRVYSSANIGEADEAIAQLFARGKSDVVVTPERVTTFWSPRPTLLVFGGGPMVEALGDAAKFLGWSAVVTGSSGDASGLAATLSPIDGVVVTGHDPESAGRVLEAALSGSVGYIGSVGPFAVRENRVDWLAFRGMTDVGRVCDPAGLAIGARNPHEVALAVVGEMIAWQTAQD